MLNLDTHILIVALSGGLQSMEQGLLATRRWSVSSIVLWELAKLVQLGRLAMDLDDREVVRTLSRLHVWPIDLTVARASPRLDFSGDPAAEIIAAVCTEVFGSLAAPPARVTTPDVPMPFAPQLERHLAVDEQKVKNAVLECLKSRP